MATVLPPQPPPFVMPGSRADERIVDEQIRRTRRSLKLVDFFSGVLTLVIGILLFLLFVSIMEHWVIPGGWNSTGRTLMFITMLAGITWYCWQAFWPLVSRSINPAYAAQLIERSTPSLKNSVLNFLLLRNRRQQLSQKVYEAIEHQAAQGLAHASVDAAVDRSILLRLGYVLVAVVAISAAYRVLSPKNLTASMARVLLPWSNIAVPSRVEILKITPGNTEVARGESLEVSAEVMGLHADETVRVRYSTLDNQTVDREVTLTGNEGSSRFQGRLPDRFSAGDNGGIQQDLEYWIEAGDAKSEKYRVTVFARPTLVVEKIRYQFPRYTGLPPREVEGTGDVSALEGTQVSVYALANHDIASADVDFNADGRHDLPMTADKMKAAAQFTLELEDDRRTPKYDSYVLQYKTTNGRSSSLPPKYSIDVTPDYAPEVKIVAPADEDGKLIEQLDVPVDTPFTVEVEARDPDFALKQVVLLGEVGGAEILKRDLLTKEQSGKFVGRMTVTPKELNLKVGDVMDYSVAAVDNREPEPNITRTEKLRIRVIGPPQFGERPQGEQQQGDGQQGGESGNGGQGQEGMQGPGEAGNSGENGEQQQGQGQAGGEGDQQQSEGDAAGEQQGQGGQGNSEGEQQETGGQQGDGESASADGENKGTQGNQQQGEQQAGADGQAGGQQSQEGGSEQGKVAADGSDDANAFDKMTEHFAEQDAESKGQGQSSKAGGETEQSESQNGNESRQGDEKGSPEDQKPTAEDGQNQDQGIDGSQEAEESDGPGAEGQPNEQREQQESDPEQGDKGEQGKTPGGKMSTEQGEPGAGNNPGENQGSMDTDEGRKARDKSDKGPDSEMNDQEPGGKDPGEQKESDSRGGASGEQSGGGQEGAGQQADADGTGTAGENTAADDGGGQAAEKGAGENSAQAGQQGASDKPTGESSETEPGEGSKQSEQAGSKPGGDQAGEPPFANNQAAGVEEPNQGESTSESGDQQKPGDSPSQDNAPAEGEQSPESQQAQESSQSSPPTGQPGAELPNGSTGGNPSSPPPPGELEPGDAANLDYAKKQTDLVLDRLEEQLEKQDVDKKLLEKLGWTEDELRRFVERWKSLKAEVEAAPSEETKQQLDNALRSLGLNPNRRTGYQSNVTKEKLRQLQDSYRGQIPLEYADQVRAYIKGTATVPEDETE